MPVITIYLPRMLSLLKKQLPVQTIIDRLPFLGLDLEEVAENYVRVEYNPNRPDLSTDYGVVRALNGLLGLEIGAPSYDATPSGFEILVDSSVRQVRPYIVSVAVRGLQLDDETIRQLISMQEDLHNGIGRRRQRVSIGIHNLDVVQMPIHYSTASPSFRFVPLGFTRSMSMREIVRETDVGRAYGWIVGRHTRYPVLIDGRQQVLSFPPVINAELTRVSTDTRNLFIDITATELQTAKDALAIMCCALHDAGGKLESVLIKHEDHTQVTPDLAPKAETLDHGLVNELLGLDLSVNDVAVCLGRSRISVERRGAGLVALVPPYRFDILHAVDLVEEVAIGYGLDNFSFTLPRGSTLGGRHRELSRLDLMREVLVGLGLTEVLNFSLIDRKTQFDRVNRKGRRVLSVESPKSGEHEVLRDCLIPSLLRVLSKNVHVEYPQRIFELGKVFIKNEREPLGVREEYHAAIAIAHSSASYSEVKALLESALTQSFNKGIKTAPTHHPMFAGGRVASVEISGRSMGVVGEVRPKVLISFQLKVPVAACEVSLSEVLRTR